MWEVFSAPHPMLMDAWHQYASTWQPDTAAWQPDTAAADQEKLASGKIHRERHGG